MKYVVVYEETPSGCSAYVPVLPGCIAGGGTREETERLIRKAIAFHLEGLGTAMVASSVVGLTSWLANASATKKHHRNRIVIG